MNNAQLHLAACARELAAARAHHDRARASLRMAAGSLERMGAAWEDAQPIERDITTATNLTESAFREVLRAADLTPSQAGIDL